MVKNMKVVIKELDRQGRLVIPKSWRERYARSGKVILRIKEGLIEILPEETFDLTKYFNSIELDLKSDLSDWHDVRRELRGVS
ncbi:MAG: AbrB/MazE/SpoVT family DNA-binding domain-containing protein [Thermoprotei archaeon]|nr:AbrB/MazE/SpoVT family DNA-binding domain-containing protein [Thermoprotei archaeon]